MEAISLARVARALGVHAPHGAEGVLVRGVSCDTRTLRAGDVFFALAGAKHDGSQFVEEAFAKGARAEEAFFWATHGGAELDLLVVRGRQRLGFECKRTDSPRMSQSIRSALADLKLDRVDVVHAGEHTFPLAERVRALALSRLYEDLEPLR